MADARYLLSRIREMHPDVAAARIREAAAASGRPRFVIAADMLLCGIRYEAGPSDYTLSEFYLLTPAQRATYVTRGYNNRLVRRFNDPAAAQLFDDKAAFARRFGCWFRRLWLPVAGADDAALARFFGACPVFFAKPLTGTGGQGVERLSVEALGGADAAAAYVREKGFGILEQPIAQHPQLSALYAGSVNTLRIVTVLDGGEADVVFAALRIGNGGAVDNLHSGGMAAVADVGTGVLTTPAADRAGGLFERHPVSGAAIRGFRVPMWEQCLALVRQAAQVVPQVGYIGWDIAVSPYGPVLVEGNPFPGHDIYQLPHLMQPPYLGMKPRFAKHMR